MRPDIVSPRRFLQLAFSVVLSKHFDNKGWEETYNGIGYAYEVWVKFMELWDSCYQ
jgi:hypothetical protein